MTHRPETNSQSTDTIETSDDSTTIRDGDTPAPEERSPVQPPGARAGEVTDDDISRRVAAAVAAADDRQAVDLKVLDLAGVSDFTDYFLICSGSNERQVSAIADAVDGALRELKVRPLHQEGTNSGRWVLLDYGDFIVHVFRDETRRFYSLERLWSDAPEVTDRFRT